MAERWEGKGYSFFCNRSCEYFPCHPTEEPDSFNCLFCYCPLYFLPDCPGKRVQIERDGKVILSCMDCDYPHRPENYGEMMKLLQKAIRER